jgi:uncharacterized membrane protein YjdF
MLSSIKEIFGMNPFKAIAWTATLIMLVFGIVGHGPGTYRFAILFLGPILWGVYFARQRIHLHPVHYAFFAGVLLFHDLGAFGAYGKFFFGLEFDTYVHFIFSVAGGLVVARALRFSFGITGWKLCVGTVLLIGGVGAIHEIIEFISTLILGPEKGMLKLNDPDKFDTQKDLCNDVLGSLVASVCYALALKVKKRTAKAGREEALAGEGNKPALARS